MFNLNNSILRARLHVLSWEVINLQLYLIVVIQLTKAFKKQSVITMLTSDTRQSVDTEIWQIDSWTERQEDIYCRYEIHISNANSCFLFFSQTNMDSLPLYNLWPNLFGVTTECMNDQGNVHTLHWLHIACTMKVTMSFFPDCAQFHGAIHTQHQLITLICCIQSVFYTYKGLSIAYLIMDSNTNINRASVYW